MKTTTSTTIDIESYKLAYAYDISFAEALEFGIKFLIAEKNGFDYPNNKLIEKIGKLQELIAKKNDNNKEEKPITKTDLPSDVEDVFNGSIA